MAIMETNLVASHMEQNKDSKSWEGDVNKVEELQSYGLQVVKLLREFKSMQLGLFGVIWATKHRIELKKNAVPVYEHPYRTRLKGKPIVAKKVEKMRKANLIEAAHPHNSEWAACFVFADEKDVSIMFCIDHKKRSAVKKRDLRAFPRMDNCLDPLGYAVISTTLDAKLGYWQILQNEDC